MNKTKFKEGDIVYIKEFEELSKLYDFSSYYNYPVGWDDDMADLADGTTPRKIIAVDNDTTRITYYIDSWWWTEDSLMRYEDISKKIHKVLLGANT